MRCKNCGSKAESNEDTFCKYCGSKFEQNTQPVSSGSSSFEEQQPHQSKPTVDNPAISMAVLGLVFSFFASLIGLIISVIALKKYKLQTNQQGKGLAIAGLTISIITISIYVFGFFIGIGSALFFI